MRYFIWSLRIKRNQWRLAVRPRPRGQARGYEPAREDAGAPLVAFISQSPYEISHMAYEI